MTYIKVVNDEIIPQIQPFRSEPLDQWLPVTHDNTIPVFDYNKQRLINVYTLSEDGKSVISRKQVEDIDIENVRNKKLRQIKKERDSALSGGFEFDGKRYQTRNTTDIANITGVGVSALTALSTSSTFYVDFIAEDNTVTTMDATQAINFFNTMTIAAQSIWNTYNAKRTAIKNATTVDEILNA